MHKWRADGVNGVRWTAQDAQGDMKAKLSRLRLRDLALLVAAAGIVAVASVVVLAGREARLGQQAGAVEHAEVVGQHAPTQESDSSGTGALTLTLTAAAEICETDGGTGLSSARMIVDEDGEFVRWETEFAGWWGVEEVQVNWAVTGGSGSYTLEIDGEPRDAFGTYEGATGSASVTCATTALERLWERPPHGGRGFVSNPGVDSGPKTIRAVVTDARGATAEASVEIYVILELGGSGDIIKAGRTYRVFGHLITAPTGRDVRVGSFQEPSCEGVPDEVRCGPSFSLLVLDSNGPVARVALFASDGAELRRQRLGPSGAVLPDSVAGAGDSLDQYLDELVESVGRYPE